MNTPEQIIKGTIIIIIIKFQIPGQDGEKTSWKISYLQDLHKAWDLK